MSLKAELQAQRVVQVDYTGHKFDPAKDFFFAYPPAARVEGLNQGQIASYHQLLSFFSSTKYQQRQLMFAGGLSVPKTRGIHNWASWTLDEKCVKRPMSHRAGSGFVVGNYGELLATLNPLTHYLSQLFIRTAEYRVIYVFGQRVCTLFKQMPPGAAQDKPWTHESGATFINLSRPQSEHKLDRLGFYAAAANFHVTKDAHICAYDVMINDSTYAVSEVNFAPSLKIESRIKAVANRIREIHG